MHLKIDQCVEIIDKSSAFEKEVLYEVLLKIETKNSMRKTKNRFLELVV